MNIDDVQITIYTPESAPLEVFGTAASGGAELGSRRSGHPPRDWCLRHGGFRRSPRDRPRGAAALHRAGRGLAARGRAGATGRRPPSAGTRNLLRGQQRGLDALAGQVTQREQRLQAGDATTGDQNPKRPDDVAAVVTPPLGQLRPRGPARPPRRIGGRPRARAAGSRAESTPGETGRFRPAWRCCRPCPSPRR